MKNSRNNNQLEDKLTEIAFSYVKKFKKEDDKQLYIYIKRGNDKKDNYYKYVFYESSILGEDLDFPYKYIHRQGKVDVSLFFFDKEREIPEDMKERLKKDSLWVSLSDIDEFKKHKPVIVLSNNPTWDVFICKENIEKFETIESPYGIEDKDKITKICN
ncbi:MAG: hypothetical protein CR989_00480 [Flavobacteriales bacterium]|nr:MAG: hypothetical protein CR989_00480 [Flavobacteriales bacterium]